MQQLRCSVCSQRSIYMCSLEACMCAHMCVLLEVPELQVNPDTRLNAQHLILFQRLIFSDFKVDPTSVLHLVQMRYGASSRRLHECCKDISALKCWHSFLNQRWADLCDMDFLCFLALHTGWEWELLCTHIFLARTIRTQVAPRGGNYRDEYVCKTDLENTGRQTGVCLFIYFWREV